MFPPERVFRAGTGACPYPPVGGLRFAQRRAEQAPPLSAGRRISPAYGEVNCAQRLSVVVDVVAEVRAERAGPGNGRVYQIGFTAYDGCDGYCSGEIKVGVPHDKKDVPVDDGAVYDSTAP